MVLLHNNQTLLKSFCFQKLKTETGTRKLYNHKGQNRTLESKNVKKQINQTKRVKGNLTKKTQNEMKLNRSINYSPLTLNQKIHFTCNPNCNSKQ